MTSSYQASMRLAFEQAHGQSTNFGRQSTKKIWQLHAVSHR
jgi:hypothetical protein